MEQATHAPRRPEPDAPRDVLLLTHPRNLREPEVIDAARALPKADRLFALTVDEEGRAELVAWAAGGLVPVRSFRVDLVGAEAARVAGEVPVPPPMTLAEWRTWTGDVEPIPFPFRPGLVSEPAGFGFDARGDWAVVVGKDGTPHGLPLAGGPPEVLPRPFAGGAVLKQVDAVLGVNGGVVLCGRMYFPVDPPPPAFKHFAHLFVAAHYDFAARRVTLHRLGSASDGVRWSADPDLQCVVVRAEPDVSGMAGCALDLATLHRFPGPESGSLQVRALEAWQRAGTGGTPPFELPVLRPEEQYLARAGTWHLYRDNAAIMPTIPASESWIAPESGSWRPFEPTRDGKPVLDGATIERAVLAGSVLCLRAVRGRDRRLLLFRGPDGGGLGEFSDWPAGGPFALSADGRRLARRRGPREVAVSETADAAATPVVAAGAGLHANLVVNMAGGRFGLGLGIGIGGYVHVFRLDDDNLTYSLGTGGPRPPDPSREQCPAVGYDGDRFPAKGVVRAGRLTAVADRLGQVLVFGAGPEPVAAFLVRRHRAAAWARGAFWGDPTLIGGPPTPGAARTIGEALRAAGA